MTLSLRRSDREGAWLRTPRSPCLLAALALASLAVPAAAPAADVRVQVTDAEVELDATAAPLADVLDRLARQTGMRLVYDGPRPRHLVTLKLRGRSPAETVLAVLEGLGVNFALVADPTGAGTQTLMVSTATPGSPTSEPRRVARSPALPPFLTQDDDPLRDDDGVAVEDVAAPPPATSELPGQSPVQVQGPDGTATPAAGASPAPSPSPPPPFPVSPFAPQPGSAAPRPFPFPMAPQPLIYPAQPPPAAAPGVQPPGDSTQGQNTKPDPTQPPPQ